MEKLYWLNRHYIKQAPPERIHRLAEAYFARDLVEGLAKEAGVTSGEHYAWQPPQEIRDWLAKVTQLIVPYVDRLEQLPERAAFIFHYDAKAALAAPDNAEVLAGAKAPAVLDAFLAKIESDGDAQAGKLTPERFKAIINEVKSETGTKGKDLFHPIRIVITGSHSGPDFDKVVPILEQGSHLTLPGHVLSVAERARAFADARPA
jgi:glutamyl-tRNA synthetase/nondiscriminating glutamyl-tRNA synthetase